VYSVLFQPLPYANADRIVRIGQRDGRDDKWWIPFGNFNDWRTQATAFDAMGAAWHLGPVTLTGQGEPKPIPITSVTAGYWKAMFISPVLRRHFNEPQARAGAASVVVLSYRL